MKKPESPSLAKEQMVDAKWLLTIRAEVLPPRESEWHAALKQQIIQAISLRRFTSSLAFFYKESLAYDLRAWAHHGEHTPRYAEIIVFCREIRQLLSTVPVESLDESMADQLEKFRRTVNLEESMALYCNDNQPLR